MLKRISSPNFLSKWSRESEADLLYHPGDLERCAGSISLHLFTRGVHTMTSLYSPVTGSKCTPYSVLIPQFISFSYIFKDCFINLESLPSKFDALAPVYFIGRNTALSLLSQFVERPRGSVRNSCRLWHKA